MPHLTVLEWVALALGAAVVGFAKTAIGGAGSIAVVLFAAVLPARESTGALLPLLLAGDLAAVRLYHRHADWGILLRLVPWVAVGVLAGTVFIARVDDDVMRRSIGIMLLVVLAVQVFGRQRLTRLAQSGHHPAAAAMAGTAAGFTTMAANAGGAVMTIYLLLAGMGMLKLLGTGAWFFFIVNLVKVPFSASLGLISATSLAGDAVLLPALAAGAAIGVFAIARINQDQFERAALGLVAVSAVLLAVR